MSKLTCRPYGRFPLAWQSRWPPPCQCHCWTLWSYTLSLYNQHQDLHSWSSWRQLGNHFGCTHVGPIQIILSVIRYTKWAFWKYHFACLYLSCYTKAKILAHDNLLDEEYLSNKYLCEPYWISEQWHVSGSRNILRLLWAEILVSWNAVVFTGFPAAGQQEIGFLESPSSWSSYQVCRHAL